MEFNLQIFKEFLVVYYFSIWNNLSAFAMQPPPLEVVMAEDSLQKRSNAFNQSSSSSRSDTEFQSSEQVAKLEFTAMLLAKAEALSSVAMRDAFIKSSPWERHHYIATVKELIVSSREQLDDVLSASRQSKLEE
jgi:hypothetical protein